VTGCRGVTGLGVFTRCQLCPDLRMAARFGFPYHANPDTDRSCRAANVTFTLRLTRGSAGYAGCNSLTSPGQGEHGRELLGPARRDAATSDAGAAPAASPELAASALLGWL